ncbi:PREDICTED: uncharacterized protein LOC104809189 [Tarenaya hassleriana]|uniref:uncharacterized protein LOC104809189 n=1 Tax=Tarenaya hassleriana TaxID=28532 RepID=UPI00053C4E03|nr:PREDICTED: uncharacterized protein LOC104809189 [Tarenaya hassleriana]XP_010533379.1 PREDICTED: uncharacterized protein LOC104809189 [Tarenaya hassleriana]
MGGVCPGGVKGSKKLKTGPRSKGLSGKLKPMKSKASESDYTKQKSFEPNEIPYIFSSELKPMPLVKTASNKVGQRNSFLGRAGMMGLERAVEVLDTLGSSVSNLNSGSGFLAGVSSSRGIKLFILAFEVANTISKGAALLQSLSEENLKLMKKDMLQSKGVKKLVSPDTAALQRIAASDKREELDVFSKEVVRFGNKCKDLQWHSLDRYFSKLDTENSHQRHLRDEADMRMQELVTLAQFTSELYHELQALDRFEQDYKRKLAEIESLNLPRRGESIIVLQNELKQQKKLVRSLQKKSLWSRNLEEIVEKLVDIVSYIHHAIVAVFGNNGLKDDGGKKGTEGLGEAGLALHYANLIQQIDSIVSRPSSLPPNVRDTLYNALPVSVKTGLRSRLQTLDPEEELSVTEIKAEMEKMLHWLVPLATNTTKAHHGFGWVGEWANSGIDYGKGKSGNNNNPTRLQTLYHADKHKADSYILELVVWLQRLMKAVRKRDHGIRVPPPYSSPHNKRSKITISKAQLSLSPDYSTRSSQLSLEDRFLLDRVRSIRFNPSLSKSQEFFGLRSKKGNKIWALSRSSGNSPSMGFSDQKANTLDIVDGLDFTFREA